jgi:hypothetical protein
MINWKTFGEFHSVFHGSLSRSDTILVYLASNKYMRRVGRSYGVDVWHYFFPDKYFKQGSGSMHYIQHGVPSVILHCMGSRKSLIDIVTGVRNFD